MQEQLLANRRQRRDTHAAPASQKLGEVPPAKFGGANEETFYLRLLLGSDERQQINNNHIKSQIERRALQVLCLMVKSQNFQICV